MTFLDHTQRRTTVGRTPLDEWPARRSDLYLTTHTQHSQQTDIHAADFLLLRDLSSWISFSVDWQLATDVSGQPVSPIFTGLTVLQLPVQLY